MIFVTVGTQLPFPRLINAMDDWGAANPANTVVAQTGERSDSAVHLDVHERMDAVRFRQMVERCDLLVAHAGMGTILSALELA